jgi:hypothetical protein
MFTELADVFLADFSATATYTPAGGGTAQPGSVIFDAPGSVVDGMDVIASEPLATLPAAQWPDLSPGAHLAIGAAVYKVRQVLPVDDGAFKRAVLARVS